MTITIQRTSKNIKAHIVASAFVGTIGFMMVGMGGFLAVIGTVLSICGVAWFFCAKIARWWNHA